MTVDGDYLRLTLSGLVQHVALDRLVDDVPAATERTIAFLRVRNTSSAVVTWDGTTNTSFIGDDGFLYEGSNIATPHADRLPDRWCASTVDVAPGRALDAVVIAQEIPEDVTVEKVMYTQHAPATGDHASANDGDGNGDGGSNAETERYLFELRPLVRERLNRLPYRR